LRGWNELSRNGHGSTSGHLLNLIVAGYIRISDDLEIPQARAVIQLNEGKGFGVAPGANPTGNFE
jgi:hypothetical protein